MQAANLYQQYKSQALQTLTQGELIVKLFEEASKQVSIAIFKINSDAVQSFNCIVKAQKIIKELNNSLDMGKAISIELREMYIFLIDKLIEANADKDVELMKQLLGLIDDLKTTFREAEKLARTGK
ncbi:MAG TPA: flagellar export chaperone FliS [Anaerovoracaceae bacterium]|nr:flagellar export chaperone FliS [Anaerovoracaceae bacterium]